MRDLPDAAATPMSDDDGMTHRDPAAVGWARDMQQLILHGRDREAVELATQHLHDDPTDTTSPTPEVASPRSPGEASDHSRIPRAGD
jgi:hypothetical protein